MQMSFEFSNFSKSMRDVGGIKDEFTKEILNSTARGVLFSRSCKPKGTLVLLNIACDDHPQNYLNKTFYSC